MLDAQKLPSRSPEALLAFWQQRVGVRKVFTFWTTRYKVSVAGLHCQSGLLQQWAQECGNRMGKCGLD
jgi:hypothetical protein